MKNENENNIIYENSHEHDNSYLNNKVEESTSKQEKQNLLIGGNKLKLDNKKILQTDKKHKTETKNQTKLISKFEENKFVKSKDQITPIIDEKLVIIVKEDKFYEDKNEKIKDEIEEKMNEIDMKNIKQENSQNEKLKKFELEEHLKIFLNRINLQTDNSIEADILDKYCISCKVFYDPIIEDSHEEHENLENSEDLKNNAYISEIFEKLENKYFSMFLKELNDYDEKFKNKIENSITEILNVLNILKASKIEDLKNFKEIHEKKFDNIKKQYFELKFKYSNFSKKNQFILNLFNKANGNTSSINLNNSIICNNNNQKRKSSLNSINPNNSISFSNSFANLNNSNVSLNNINKSRLADLGIDKNLLDIIQLINMDLRNQIEIAEKNFEDFLKEEKQIFILQGESLDNIFVDFESQINKMIKNQISNEMKNDIPEFDKNINIRIKKYSKIFEKIKDNFLKSKTLNYNHIEKKISDMETNLNFRNIRKISLDLKISSLDNLQQLKDIDLNSLNNIDNIENLNFDVEGENLLESIHNKTSTNVPIFKSSSISVINPKTNNLNTFNLQNLKNIQNFTNIGTPFESPTKKIDFSKISISDLNSIESIKNSKLHILNGNKTNRPIAVDNKRDKKQLFSRDGKNKLICENTKNPVIFNANISTNTPIKIINQNINKLNEEKEEFHSASFTNKNQNLNENEFPEENENKIEIEKDKKLVKPHIFKSNSSNIIKKKQNLNYDYLLSNNHNSTANLMEKNKNNSSTSSLKIKANESNVNLNLTGKGFNNSLRSQSLAIKRKTFIKKYFILSLLETIEEIENDEEIKDFIDEDTNKPIKQKNDDNSLIFNNSLLNNDYLEDGISVKLNEKTTEILIYDRQTSDIKRQKIPLLKDVHGYDSLLDGSRHVIIDDKIYITGGRDEKTYYDIFLEYDINSNILKRLPNMNYSRAYHCFIFNAKFKKIYALGGELNKTCEFFDLYSQKWFVLPDFNFPRAYINCFFAPKDIQKDQIFTQIIDNFNIKNFNSGSKTRPKLTNRNHSKSRSKSNNKKTKNKADSQFSKKEKTYYIYAFFGIKSEMSKMEFTEVIETLEIEKDGNSSSFEWRKFDVDNRSDLDMRNKYVRIFPFDSVKIVLVGNCISRYNTKSFAYLDLSKNLILKLDDNIMIKIKDKSQTDPIYKRLLTDINISINKDK